MIRKASVCPLHKALKLICICFDTVSIFPDSPEGGRLCEVSGWTRTLRLAHPCLPARAPDTVTESQRKTTTNPTQCKNNKMDIGIFGVKTNNNGDQWNKIKQLTDHILR